MNHNELVANAVFENRRQKMICVGIDVSKGKSTMFAMDENGTVFSAPQEIQHTKGGMDNLVQRIHSYQDETKVVLESTGYYHWPVVFSLLDAGIFITVVNPILMSKFSKEALRTAKTDKLDSITIARYGLVHWNELHCCAKFDGHMMN
jgi:transposase